MSVLNRWTCRVVSPSAVRYIAIRDGEPVISRDNDITRQMGTDRSIQIIARSRSLISQGRRELFRHILTSLTLKIDFRFFVWLLNVISILPILLWLLIGTILCLEPLRDVLLV